MKIFSKEESLSSYQWGNNCKAWIFVDEPSLSIKLELMPPGSSEELHFHKQAQQFFFILKGEAQFELPDKSCRLTEGEGIHIMPNQLHRVYNSADQVLEFLVTSQPAVVNDRFLHNH